MNPWEQWLLVSNEPLLDVQPYVRPTSRIAVGLPPVSGWESDMSITMGVNHLIPSADYDTLNLTSMPPPTGKGRLPTDLYHPSSSITLDEQQRYLISMKHGVPLSKVPSKSSYVPQEPVIWESNFRIDWLQDPRFRYVDGSLMQAAPPVGRKEWDDNLRKYVIHTEQARSNIGDIGDVLAGAINKLNTVGGETADLVRVLKEYHQKAGSVGVNITPDLFKNFAQKTGLKAILDKLTTNQKLGMERLEAASRALADAVQKMTQSAKPEEKDKVKKQTEDLVKKFTETVIPPKERKQFIEKVVDKFPECVIINDDRNGDLRDGMSGIGKHPIVDLPDTKVSDDPPVWFPPIPENPEDPWSPPPPYPPRPPRPGPSEEKKEEYPEDEEPTAEQRRIHELIEFTHEIIDGRFGTILPDNVRNLVSMAFRADLQHAGIDASTITQAQVMHHLDRAIMMAFSNGIRNDPQNQAYYLMLVEGIARNPNNARAIDSMIVEGKLDDQLTADIMRILEPATTDRSTRETIRQQVMAFLMTRRRQSLSELLVDLTETLESASGVPRDSPTTTEDALKRILEALSGDRYDPSLMNQIRSSFNYYGPQLQMMNYGLYHQIMNRLRAEDPVVEEEKLEVIKKSKKYNDGVCELNPTGFNPGDFSIDTTFEGRTKKNIELTGGTHAPRAGEYETHEPTLHEEVLEAIRRRGKRGLNEEDLTDNKRRAKDTEAANRDARHPVINQLDMVAADRKLARKIQMDLQESGIGEFTTKEILAALAKNPVDAQELVEMLHNARPKMPGLEPYGQPSNTIDLIQDEEKSQRAKNPKHSATLARVTPAKKFAKILKEKASNLVRKKNTIDQTQDEFHDIPQDPVPAFNVNSATWNATGEYAEIALEIKADEIDDLVELVAAGDKQALDELEELVMKKVKTQATKKQLAALIRILRGNPRRVNVIVGERDGKVVLQLQQK